jgi:hypothetical protein
LASILKKESTIDEDEGNDQKEEKVKLTAEKGEEGKVNPDKGAEIEDSKDERDHDNEGSPSPGTLRNAAPAIINILMDLLKRIVFERLSCRLCFGLEDPADTAVLSGYLWSVASTLGLFRANVFIEPYFEGERLEGEIAAELKTRLIWIAKAVINASLEKEIRSLIREVAGWN